MDVSTITPNYDTTAEHSLRTRLLTALFGDRLGVTLFLGAFTFAGLFWHIGVFINDNYTIANALYNLANGHLPVTDIIYGPESGATPGMVTSDGNRYGRNYGQIVATLPVVYALRGLAAVADLRLVLIGLWSLSLLALSYQIGRLTNRHTLATRIGAVGALTTFALNTAFATPLNERWISVLALQLTSLIAAAFVAVLTYRLLTRIHTPKIGLAAGLAIVFATPVSFWGAIPKRHTYMAALVLAVVYSFYRSREATNPQRALRFRALAYAFVGLSTWLQPAEALVMFVSLLAVDLLTAESNSLREATYVGTVFAVSLLPFFITNFLIAGNPLTPPRVLQPVGRPGVNPPTVTNDSSLFARALGAAFAAGSRFWGMVSNGFIAVTEPTRLYHVFLRGGYIEEVASKDLGHAINLSLLESAPIFAALVALPTALSKRVSQATPRALLRRRRTLSARHATDVLVAATALLFILFYLPRLPLHAMITVRYLLPAMALLLYAVFRLRAVHKLFEYPRTLTASFAVTVCIGTQLLVVALILLDTNLGETAQVHAWVNLATATLLAGWVLIEGRLPERYTPVGAALFGVTAGATTAFLLLAGVVYFALEPGFVLPVIEHLSEAVSWL